VNENIETIFPTKTKKKGENNGRIINLIYGILTHV
jgi:hypothetical protein